jgi:hypothetical protein
MAIEAASSLADTTRVPDESLASDAVAAASEIARFRRAMFDAKLEIMFKGILARLSCLVPDDAGRWFFCFASKTVAISLTNAKCVPVKRRQIINMLRYFFFFFPPLTGKCGLHICRFHGNKFLLFDCGK